MALALDRKTLVLVKSETTYGTDPTPSESTDTMLIYGDGAGVWSADNTLIDKAALRASLTPTKQLVGRAKGMFKPATVLMSKNPSKPFFAPLLKACGLKETSATVSSSSSWTYAPSDTGPSSSAADFQSCTAYVYSDGVLCKVNGVLGTGSLSMQAGQAPDLTFDMQGIYNAPITASMPSPVTYPSDTKVLVESESLLIGSYTPIVRSLTFNFGTSVVERADANSAFGFKGVHISGRKATLEIVVEAENTLASKDFFAELRAATVSNAITWTHATGSTSKILFSVPTPQITNVAISQQDGIKLYTVSYECSSATDGADYSIEFREKP